MNVHVGDDGCVCMCTCPHINTIVIVPLAAIEVNRLCDSHHWKEITEKTDRLEQTHNIIMYVYTFAGATGLYACGFVHKCICVV